MSSTENEEEINVCKIILIGDSNVGKTAIINRLSDDEFYDGIKHTIGIDFRTKDIEVDGTTVHLQIWDTAGQERFKSITKSFYRGAQGVIVVYAINHAKSFQNVRTWLADIDKNVALSENGGNKNGSNSSSRNAQQPPVVKYLVGNKTDLADERVVDTNAGQCEANTFGAKFMETSAKTSHNVEKLFVDIARDIKRNARIAPKVSDVNLDSNSETPKSGGCC